MDGGVLIRIGQNKLIKRSTHFKIAHPVRKGHTREYFRDVRQEMR